MLKTAITAENELFKNSFFTSNIINSFNLASRITTEKMQTNLQRTIFCTPLKQVLQRNEFLE
jgi:hypothetical protein